MDDLFVANETRNGMPTERCHPVEVLAGKGIRTYFDGAQHDPVLPQASILA